MAKAKKEYIAVCNFFKNTQPLTRKDMRELLSEVLGGEIQAWMEMNKEWIANKILRYLTQNGRHEMGSTFYGEVAKELVKKLNINVTPK